MPTFALSTEEELIKAQHKAELLFLETERQGLICAGKTEKDLSDQIYQLAMELFGIRKYWHKRIVRTGANTLCSYRENPPNLTIAADDLIFFDFGPVFDEWEADFGRTYLLGHDPIKQRMVDDLEKVFKESQEYFNQNNDITGKQLFNDVIERSQKRGWLYGGTHAGHLIGIFPHERNLGECPENYICPENNKPLRDPDIKGETRHWILEIHLIDSKRQYGAFYEELLSIDVPKLEYNFKPDPVQDS